jgi:tRNA pseudouridine38-40 synthase
MEREVLASRWESRGDLWLYRVEAGSFLHHMVRNLVGTFLQVGLSRRQPEEIDRILEARDRRAAGPTAPAQGLFLEAVRYEEDEE